MARVKNYVNDTTLSNDDRLFGTDGAGGINTNANFTLGDLKEFINTGVDIVAKTPKFNVPVINEASDDAEVSTIRLQVVPQAGDIKFFNTEPADIDADPTITQVDKGQFTIFNSGGGYFLEVKEYKGRLHLPSFVGKNLTITAGVSDTVVTALIGELEEVDEKNYIVDIDGDVIHRFNLTRTGDLETTWANLVSSRSIATEVFVLAGDNEGETLDLVTVTIDGDTSVGMILAEELTALKIILPEGGDGLTFGDEDGDNYFNMNSDADGNMIFTGFGESTLIVDAPVDLRKTLNVEGETNFNENIIVAEAKSLTFQSDDLIENDNRLVLDHEGIKHTLHGANERLITAVDANDSIDSPEEQGVMTSLQIGAERYTVPTSISQIAQTLPGLYEGLSPVPGDVVIESIRRHNAGRYNDTTILADDTTSYINWVADIGHVSLLAAGDPLALGDSTFTVGGLDDLVPILTSAQQATANYMVAVTPNEDSKINFGVAQVGDEIRLHTNATTFIQYNITTIESQSFQESGQDRIVYLFGLDTFVDATPQFVIDTDTDYQISAVNTTVNVDITTGTWFYGIDNGTFVEYKSTVAVQPTAIDFAIGDDSKTDLTPDTALQTADAGTPNGERLFFVDSTNDISALVDGDTVPGNAYEIVAYVHDNPLDDNATITFSRIGDGDLHISTPSLTISNIPEASGIVQDFLVLDSDDKVKFRQLDEIAGVQAQVNYEDTNQPADNGVLQGISFITGSNNHNLESNGGNLSVDVSGKIPVQGTALVADTDLEDWRAYVLSDPGTGGATLTLPAVADLESGATVRLYNLSDIDPDGLSVIPDGIWSVTTDLPSERIMRDLDDLELDEITTVDLVWTGNPNDGWIIK